SGIGSVLFADAPLRSGAWLNLPLALPLPRSAGAGPSLIQPPGATWAARWDTNNLTGVFAVKATATSSAGVASAQVLNVTFGDAAPRGPPGITLTATPIAGGVRLTWPSAGVTYQVRRSTVGLTGPFNLIGSTASAAYEDLGLVPGASYSYQLSTPAGAASGVVSAIPPAESESLTMVTAGGGGTATSADGTASVSFAPGSVSSPVSVSVSHSTAGVPLNLQAVSPVFELNAVDASTGARVDTFAAEPTVTVHYDPSALRAPSLYYLDPVNGATAIPAAIDPVAHTLTAALPHFSTYVVALNDPTAPQAGNYTLSYSSLVMSLSGPGCPSDPGCSTTLTADTDAATVPLATAHDLPIGDLTTYNGNLTI